MERLQAMVCLRRHFVSASLSRKETKTTKNLKNEIFPEGFSEMMTIISQTLSFFAVALVWGITNPLLKKGSVGIEKIKRRGKLHQLLSELTFLALRWQYAVPFLINQTGLCCITSPLARPISPSQFQSQIRSPSS